MKTKPLTAYQISILKRFQAGEVMYRCVHTRGGASYFFHCKVGVNFRATAVRALLSHGLIEDCEDPALRWRGSEYRVSQKGMDYGREVARG